MGKKLIIFELTDYQYSLIEEAVNCVRGAASGEPETAAIRDLEDIVTCILPNLLLATAVMVNDATVVDFSDGSKQYNT